MREGVAGPGGRKSARSAMWSIGEQSCGGGSRERESWGALGDTAEGCGEVVKPLLACCGVPRHSACDLDPAQSCGFSPRMLQQPGLAGLTLCRPCYEYIVLSPSPVLVHRPTSTFVLFQNYCLGIINNKFQLFP